MSSNRWLVVIAGTVVVLMLASVITVVTGSSRRGTTYATDSPEAAVERYVQAVLDGDIGAVQAAFMPSLTIAPNLTSTCIEDLLRWDIHSVSGSGSSWRMSATDTTVLTNGETRVALRATQVTVSPPFDVYEYARDETFHLRQSDGHWFMTSVTWPHRCPWNR